MKSGKDISKTEGNSLKLLVASSTDNSYNEVV